MGWWSPNTLYPQHIPHRIAWEWTEASTVRFQQLTAWTMVKRMGYEMSSCYKPVKSGVMVSLLQHVRLRQLCLQPNNTCNITYSIQCWLVTIHYYRRWVQKCTSGGWLIIRFYASKFLTFLLLAYQKLFKPNILKYPSAQAHRVTLKKIWSFRSRFQLFWHTILSCIIQWLVNGKITENITMQGPPTYGHHKHITWPAGARNEPLLIHEPKKIEK